MYAVLMFLYTQILGFPVFIYAVLMFLYILHGRVTAVLFPVKILFQTANQKNSN